MTYLQTEKYPQIRLILSNTVCICLKNHFPVTPDVLEIVQLRVRLKLPVRLQHKLIWSNEVFCMMWFHWIEVFFPVWLEEMT